jgi:predicted enzyme related to lactoylglutathione lyase
MEKFATVVLFIVTFFLGYGFSRLTAPVDSGPRVTGIGGIFFKAKDPAMLKTWYSKNLGMRMDQSGTNFEWRQGTDSTQKGFTLWAPFKETTKYFLPSDKQFMINYRVVKLDQLLLNLKVARILPTDTIEKASYGKFIHIMDPEGNKIELWEPNDAEYAKLAKTTIK